MPRSNDHSSEDHENFSACIVEIKRWGRERDGENLHKYDWYFNTIFDFIESRWVVIAHYRFRKNTNHLRDAMNHGKKLHLNLFQFTNCITNRIHTHYPDWFLWFSSAVHCFLCPRHSNRNNFLPSHLLCKFIVSEFFGGTSGERIKVNFWIDLFIFVTSF